jgi:hypothetical protein
MEPARGLLPWKEWPLGLPLLDPCFFFFTIGFLAWPLPACKDDVPLSRSLQGAQPPALGSARQQKAGSRGVRSGNEHGQAGLAMPCYAASHPTFTSKWSPGVSTCLGRDTQAGKQHCLAGHILPVHSPCMGLPYKIAKAATLDLHSTSRERRAAHEHCRGQGQVGPCGELASQHDPVQRYAQTSYDVR